MCLIRQEGRQSVVYFHTSIVEAGVNDLMVTEYGYGSRDSFTVAVGGMEAKLLVTQPA